MALWASGVRIPLPAPNFGVKCAIGWGQQQPIPLVSTKDAGFLGELNAGVLKDIKEKLLGFLGPSGEGEVYGGMESSVLEDFHEQPSDRESGTG